MKAIYAGSFDPITEGHWDIIERARLRVDELTIVVATNPTKNYMFSIDERIELIMDGIPSNWKNVDVISGGNSLTVQIAQRIGARTLIRGLRPHGDFEAEYSLALVNKNLAPMVETMFLIAKPELIAVSSSVVKELARHRQDIGQYVSPLVKAAIEKKLLTYDQE